MCFIFCCSIWPYKPIQPPYTYQELNDVYFNYFAYIRRENLEKKSELKFTSELSETITEKS